jgi:Anti-sigma-28 factor, FlgM
MPMQESESMDVDREKRMIQITEQIRHGEYQVDPGAVADAIVRRLGMVAALTAMPTALGPEGTLDPGHAELRSCAHTQ